MNAATTPLQWERPGPGAWRLDSAHTFGPVTRLMQDIFPAAMAAGFRSFTGRYGLPISHIEVRYVHGFAYGSVRLAGIPTSERPPPPAGVLRLLTRVHPVLRRRNRHALRALEQRVWQADLREWFDTLRPTRLATVHTLQAVEPTTLTDIELAAHLEECVDALASGLREHFSLVGASAIPVGLYVAHQRALGRTADAAIADLAGAAADSTAATLPTLRAIRTALAEVGATPTTLEGIRQASTRAALALDAYLAEFGERVVGALDVTGSRLVELPDVIVRSVSAAGDGPPRSVADGIALDPDDMVADARLAVASRDDHAGICCMWPLGLVRRALLAAGTRLHDAGLLDDAEHVLDATAGEVAMLLHRVPQAPASRLLAERSAARRRLAAAEPPPLIGVEHPPPDPSVFAPGTARMTAAMTAFLDTQDTSARTGRAIGIGRTVHRGRAVVALDAEDAIGRLQRGDVLITRTTTPAFNCVLPIAGALVTVHGGPMSHAGIAARELGIPAVLGVADALDRIADGTVVDVDPVDGVVRPAPEHLEFGPGLRTPALDVTRIGAKAAGLVTMSNLGLPVPPGVVLPIAPAGPTEEAVRAAVQRLEEITGRTLGDDHDPLLVSVRSGAAVSMPGMMDTVLNVGMTPAVAVALARSGGEAFADDTHRRFLAGFAALGCPIPADPVDQVVAAARAVHRSWNGDRSRAFRQRAGVAGNPGTAVTIQAMVFGNLDPTSGSGVAFSRDPSSGADRIVGDVVVTGQGDDAVGGAHATDPIATLADRWPDVYRELVAAVRQLERHHADMVDVEFTVERGRLYLLQCRRGARTATADVRIAVDMAEDPEFRLSRADAVERCRYALRDRRAPASPLAAELVAEHAIVRGIAASPGRGCGVLTVSVEDALRRHAAGASVVLVRPTTSPDDVAGMAVAAGVVTMTGGLVSHTALVARSWGVPAIVGATGLVVDADGVRTAERRIAVGELVTVDGSEGVLLAGAHPGAPGDPVDVAALATLRRWAAELDASPATAAPVTVDGDDTVAAPDVLRLVALRGRTDVTAVGSALGASRAAVGSAVAELAADGLLTADGDELAATDLGRRRLATDLAAVVAVHADAFTELLGRFQRPNRALKQLLSEHQLGHTDDVAPTLLEGVAAVHHEVAGIIAAAAARVPRLERYRARLTAAIDRLAAGDHRYLAHPAVDSVHTIWFELHEELIRLAGTDRVSEASAGRA